MLPNASLYNFQITLRTFSGTAVQGALDPWELVCMYLDGGRLERSNFVLGRTSVAPEEN